MRLLKQPVGGDSLHPGPAAAAARLLRSQRQRQPPPQGAHGVDLGGGKHPAQARVQRPKGCLFKFNYQYNVL